MLSKYVMKHTLRDIQSQAELPTGKPSRIGTVDAQQSIAQSYPNLTT
jgi:hypothetical protein